MNQRKIILLLDDILNKVSDLKTSEILPKVLTVSKLLGDEKFERWIQLETSGYFNTNPALTRDDKVPDYRKVPGQYHDKQGNPLIIDNPAIFNMVNHYPLREGISELETMSENNGLLSFRNPTVMSMMKDNFQVDVDTFTFSANSINGILSTIKTLIISWLVEKQKEISAKENSAININIPSELSSLHPLVQRTAGELFKNGHYRQAILDTYIALVEAVKTKSGRHDLDNTPLMQSVFSIKNPTITVSDDSDEQLGFMWLFTGAVMGIRNPKAHRLIEQNDPQRTLEWLSFASVLMRVLDDSRVS